MTLQADSRHALELLEKIQEKLRDQNDPSCEDDLATLIYMLDSPLFTQLLGIQDSLKQLKQVQEIRSLDSGEFDFDPSSGKLQINQRSDEENDSAVPPDAYTSNESVPQATENVVVSKAEVHDGDFWTAIEKAALSREVSVIQLHKSENTSLGFSVVGLKSENKGELGIFVKEIQPRGIAARDGRLQENDQILAIDGRLLDSGISHQQAIQILQKASGQVELVTARGPAIWPESEQTTPSPLDSNSNQNLAEGSDMVISTEWTQLEVIDLINDGSGLGFGIIGGKSTGVVVKTILPGGVADRDGRLQSGDHILHIGDVNVRSMGSEQVACVLRQSGSHVRLVVARGVNEPPQMLNMRAPVIPTHDLEQHLQSLYMNMQMTESQERLEYENMMSEGGIALTADYINAQTPLDDQEVEIFVVELVKDTQGLGITIAGYIGDQASGELSGIFIKSVADGSAAAVDGRVQVNDQIIQVDSHSLEGFTNHQAVEVLRNTGQVVMLKLARYKYGPKYDQLQELGSQAQLDTLSQEHMQQREDKMINLDEIRLMSGDDYSGELQPEVEQSIKANWQAELGDTFEIVVAQLSKFREKGGLGISLEGTVDVEDGVEKRPHHYIRSVLSDGPVGVNGRLQSGDELLEVNGMKLMGLNHVEVVTILKELPQHVRIVCARHRMAQQSDFVYAQTRDQFFQTPSAPYAQGTDDGGQHSDRLIKAKSEQALPVASGSILDSSLNKGKSRSLEPMTGLATWSDEPIIIELQKGDRGLGFSILDYQDPLNPDETVIIIRSLVPGGVAQMDGRLVPGDRLVFVNDVQLDNATLDKAVQALKGAPKGLVQIGVTKALPLPEIGESSTDDLPSSASEPILSTTTAMYNEKDLSPPPHSPPPPPPVAPLPDDDGDDSVAYELISLTKTEEEVGISQDTLEQLNTKEMEVEKEEKNLGLEKRVVLATVKNQHEVSGRSSFSSDGSDIDLGGEYASIRVETPKEEPKHMPIGDGIYEDIDLYKNDSPTGSPQKQKKLIIPNLNDFDHEEVVSTSSDKEEKHQENQDTAIYATPMKRKKPPTPPKPQGYALPPPPSPPPREYSDEKEEVTSPPLPYIPPPEESSTDYEVLMQKTEVTSVAQAPPHQESPRPESPPPYTPPAPVTSSDLMLTTTHSSTSSTPLMSPSNLSPVPSPSMSPHSWSSFGEIPPLPAALERSIKVKKGGTQLGLSVESVDKGLNGCVVKAIDANGAVGKDGRIQVGDFIVTVNNETLRRVTSAQAKAILRRASLVNTDINITYIPSLDAEVHRTSAMIALREQQPPPQTSQLSPNSQLSPVHSQASEGAPTPPESIDGGRSATSIPSALGSPLEEEAQIKPEAENPTSEEKKEIQEELVAATVVAVQHTAPERDISPERDTDSAQSSLPSPSQSWAQPRLVEIHRQETENIGISIVGGKVDLFHASPESHKAIVGIFIKNILPTSPAGKNGTLKTGDRILEVDGHDLRTATHDKAVEVIRKATSPVRFLVQSIADPSWTVNGNLIEQKGSMEPTVNEKIESSPRELPCPTSPTSSEPPSPSHAVEEEDDAPPALPASRPPIEADENEVERQSEGKDETWERIVATYGELNGELHVVEFETSNNGLGLSLAGNRDLGIMSVFVAGVLPDSPTARDGRIHVGDELLEINGQVLYGRSHLNASAIIKGINSNKVKIILLRRKDFQNHMAIKPLRLPPVDRKDDPNTLITPKVKGKDSQNDSETPSTNGSAPADNHVIPADANKADLSKFKHVKNVNLLKGPKGLGFAIQEGNTEGKEGIFIKTVTPGGVADEDGTLEVGDQILTVDDTSLMSTNYEKAIEILRTTPQGTVRLVIDKCVDDMPEETATPAPTPAEAKPAPEKTETKPEAKTSEQEKKAEPKQQEKVASLAPPKPASPPPSEDPATCPITAGRETRIEIQKGKSGLGLSIVGGSDTLLGAIIVHEVYEDGAAARDGRLWAGDQVLEVNYEDLRDATHDRAIQVLRQTPAVVQMVVYRDETQLKDEDLYDIFTVEMVKKPNKGLGLSIVGRRNDVGVFISDIVKGGVAEADGRLMQGDQILSVNGEDMKNASQEDAAAILKTLMGKVTLTVGRFKGSRSSSRRNSGSSAQSAGIKKSDSSVSSKAKGKHTKSHSGSSSDVRIVTLERDARGALGLSIAGGQGSPLGDIPVLVAQLQPDSPAARNGNIMEGDQIISINGHSTEGMTHIQAVDLLKSIEGTIELELLHGEEYLMSSNRNSEHHEESEWYEEPDPAELMGDEDQYKTIKLERGPEGLGFSIVGGYGSPHGDLPIYIKSVFSKGAAADDGNLKRGDQIVAVNGESLEGVTHDEAVNILKRARGTINLTILT